MRQQHTVLLVFLIFELFFVEESDSQLKRMWWVHPMNKIRGELGSGEFHSQVQELKMYPDQFYRYFCMPMNKFFKLLNMLKRHKNISK